MPKGWEKLFAHVSSWYSAQSSEVHGLAIVAVVLLIAWLGVKFRWPKVDWPWRGWTPTWRLTKKPSERSPYDPA